MVARYDEKIRGTLTILRYLLGFVINFAIGTFFAMLLIGAAQIEQSVLYAAAFYFIFVFEFGLAAIFIVQVRKLAEHIGLTDYL
jgi:hypothetical protein